MVILATINISRDSIYISFFIGTASMKTPSEVLQENLAIISRSRTIAESVQTDYRQGKVSKEAALSQINNTLDQAKAATTNISAYERQNRGYLKNQGLTESFSAAEQQGENAVKFSENVYKFIGFNSPDQTNVPKVKNELSVKKAYILPTYANAKTTIDQLNQLVSRNATKAQIDQGLATATNTLSELNNLLNQTEIYENLANSVGLKDEVSWAQSTRQAIKESINQLAGIIANLRKKTPSSAGAPAAPPAATTEQVTTNPSAPRGSNSVPGIRKAQAQAVQKDTTNFESKKDWRVRLALSPGAQQAKYLYYSDNPGILAPLQVTDGVIFPYTPNITLSYNASYDANELVHTNYKIYQYKNSSVDSINITCDFTAQDTYEANYLLAVIHFFRSATKMFYGQDGDPKPGTPPPLCYLFGLGEFQFNAHPLVIYNFAYTLPSEVDYIRAGNADAPPGSNRNSTAIQSPKKPNPTFFDALAGSISNSRLVQGVAKIGNVIGLDIIPGGNLSGPSFQNNTGYNSVVPPGTNEPTYVPTKIQLSISCNPIVSRNDISNKFSLAEYANGKLLQGVKRQGGGMW